MACRRVSLEDRILDYSICLESTLLFGMRDELKYRLALRGAKLLGKHCDPQETFNKLKCLYDIRSKIVHDGHTFDTDEVEKEIKRIGLKPGEFNEATDLLMRQILTAIISKRLHGETGRRPGSGYPNVIPKQPYWVSAKFMNITLFNILKSS